MCMTPHGPDAATFEAAVAGGDGQQAPAHLPPDGLAFMFETHWTPRITQAVSTRLHVYKRAVSSVLRHIRHP